MLLHVDAIACPAAEGICVLKGRLAHLPSSYCKVFGEHAQKLRADNTSAMFSKQKLDPIRESGRWEDWLVTSMLPRPSRRAPTMAMYVFLTSRCAKAALRLLMAGRVLATISRPPVGASSL